MIKSKTTVPDNRITHKAEQLLNSPEISYQGTIGFNRGFAGDKIAFIQLPKLSVREIEDEGYVGYDGKEVTVAELSFTNLQESVGQMARLIIYYETVSTTFQLPEQPSLSWLQTKRLLAEVPVLSVENDLVLKYEVSIPQKPVSYFCFYAVYLNQDGRVAEKDGMPLITYAVKRPFYGVNLLNNIFEMPGVTASGITESDEIQTLPQSVITLNFLDFGTVKSEHDWNSRFQDFRFRDSFNHFYALDYKKIKMFDYALIYEFISKNGLNPIGLMPRNIDYFSQMPTVEDPNGTWRLAAVTKDNSITLTLPSESTVGYWVGFKLRS